MLEIVADLFVTVYLAALLGIAAGLTFGQRGGGS